MTKKRPRTAWPAELDKPPNLNLPTWETKRAPLPGKDMDGYLAWGKALQKHYAKCDQRRADEVDRLLKLWLEYLKIKDSEGAREALLRIAELEDLPAFRGLFERDDWQPVFTKKPTFRRSPEDKELPTAGEALGLLRRLAFVEAYQQQNPGASTTDALVKYRPEAFTDEALLRSYPELNKLPRGEQKKELREARKKKLRKEQQYLGYGKNYRKRIRSQDPDRDK
jgi:hypothetical protein